jgi:hypothetical protein
MLRSLDDEPVTGTPHDRVFDIIMRRLELMDGDKAAVRSIAKAPVSSAAGFMTLAGSLLQSQDWILSAAGIEDNGMRGALKTSGLAWVYVKTLRTWPRMTTPACLGQWRSSTVPCATEQTGSTGWKPRPPLPPRWPAWRVVS